MLIVGIAKAPLFLAPVARVEAPEVLMEARQLIFFQKTVAIFVMLAPKRQNSAVHLVLVLLVPFEAPDEKHLVSLLVAWLRFPMVLNVLEHFSSELTEILCAILFHDSVPLVDVPAVRLFLINIWLLEEVHAALVKEDPALDKIFRLDALVVLVVGVDSLPILVGELSWVKAPVILQEAAEVLLLDQAIFIWVVVVPHLCCLLILCILVDLFLSESSNVVDVAPLLVLSLVLPVVTNVVTHIVAQLLKVVCSLASCAALIVLVLRELFRLLSVEIKGT